VFEFLWLNVLASIVGFVFLLSLFFIAVGYTVMWYDERKFQKLKDSLPPVDLEVGEVSQEFLQKLKNFENNSLKK
jgi:hypothetical protein